MSSESEFANTTASARSDSVITDESSPRIIVFVAGAQSRVEAAAEVARKLYPGRNLVFVCETIHCGWLSQRAGESIFVVEQPFNPFGRKASELRKSLEAVPIEACGLVIADIGHESFRFRVFALRLRTRRFLLLHGAAPSDSKQLDRLSFALLAGMTLFFRWPRKVRVSHHGSASQGHDMPSQVPDTVPQVLDLVPQVHDLVPEVPDKLPQNHDVAAQGHDMNDMTPQQQPTESKEVIPEPAVSSNRQSQCATRDSGLVRFSNGWDDALGFILFIHRLLVMVKSGARILDFGCGAGSMVFRLRELGFDAYGFDIHDYVAYRSDDDRQWFRFSQSTSRDTSAFTIDADRYAIPFEDDFFDVVHSTSVIEHVLDIRPMMRECARVLRPDGVSIHFYPAKYQLVEPHLYVPLASFVQYKQWLRLWVALGARNEFQSGLTVHQVTEAYKQYTMTGLRYRTRRELLYAAAEFFDGVRFMSRAVSPGDSLWLQVRQMMKSLRTRDVYRQLALCVRLSALICDHKKSTATQGS
jgi:2-polyprenyl-3-methyl-5-hydroxy-6-metoxy-1,4-benzoquinol methylase